MAQVTLPYNRHKCPLLRKHEYTQCFLNSKCLRAQNGVLYEVPASYNAPFSCVCGAFTDDFWAYPAVEEFAE